MAKHTYWVIAKVAAGVPVLFGSDTILTIYLLNLSNNELFYRSFYSSTNLNICFTTRGQSYKALNEPPYNVKVLLTTNLYFTIVKCL